MTTDRVNLHGLTPATLHAHLTAAGAPATLAHARSLLAWHLAFDPRQRPKRTSVPRAVQEVFERCVSLARVEVVERAEDPSDGFVKYLLRSPDGALSEAVRIPLEAPGRYSICLSSQVGCAMGCVFCATGRLGLGRNLAAWEIVSAFCQVRDELPDGARITGAVFMGQGEPFHNYDAVLGAAAILSDPCGGRIAARAISISTVGLVPEIRRFTAEGHRYRLVVSLTSAISERRRRLLPVTRKWDVPELAAAIRAHAQATGERVTVAWVVLAGENTGDDEIAALRELFEGVPIKLNIIDLNDGPSDLPLPAGEPSPLRLRRVDQAELDRFRDRLRTLGVPVVRRYSGGRARHAACGMLAARAHPT